MNIDTQNLKELMEKTREEFRFKYVGGGYFRDKSVAVGEKAELLHGEEVIEEFCRELMRRVLSSSSDPI